MEFRPWLVLAEASQQETQALKILGGDEGVLGQLKSISPEPKFLPVLALFRREQPDLGQLGRDWAEYKRLLDGKKMPVLAVQGNNVVVPPQNQPVTYLQWTEKVHAMSGDIEMVKKRVELDHSGGKPPIFKNDTLEVYETDGPGDCIRYGRGYNFCISQPGNTMWQSYRDNQTSTFYFVYDKSRRETDPLHIVVVDITKDGPILTDASNRTGFVAEYRSANDYLEHLYARGVPRNLFRNKPHTEEEEEERNALGFTMHSLAWFRGLTAEQKSKYIGRGHELSDEQFDYIFDNGMESLVKQYAEMGRKPNGHQMDRLLGSKFRSTYLHFRAIADQHKNDIDVKEYERMSPEQRKAIGPKSRARMAGATGDLDYIESMKDKGSWATKWYENEGKHTPNFLLVLGAARYGRVEILRTMIDEAKKLISFGNDVYFSENMETILYEAVRGDQDEAAKMILGEFGEEKSDGDNARSPWNIALSLACEEGRPKVLKMLAEKYWDRLGADRKEHLFWKASDSGNHESVKYLSGLIFSRPRWASYLMPLHALRREIAKAAGRNDYEMVRHLVDTLEKVVPEGSSDETYLDLRAPVRDVSKYLGEERTAGRDDIRTLKFLVEKLLGFKHPMTPSMLKSALEEVCKGSSCNLKAAAYLMLRGAKDPGPGNAEQKVLRQIGAGEDMGREQIEDLLRKAAESE